MAAGARLCLALPGGGGYGTPADRPEADIRADLEAGYITLEEARTVYGLKN